MTKPEQSRAAAKTEMEVNWAKSIGNCGLCSKAARGECSAVIAMARAAGLNKEAAKTAIKVRIENEHASEP